MLLVILMEECNELAQQASKAIRFGIDQQRDLPTSNRQRLIAEWNDLIAVVEMLEREGIDLQPDPAAILSKKKKVDRYMSYSSELGTLKV